MRIAYLSASTVPSRNANSVHVMKMCRAFASHGHEVSLVTQNRRSELVPAADPFEFYGIDRTFDLHPLLWAPVRGRSYLYGALAARLAAKLDVDLVYGRSLQACYAAAMRGLPVVYEAHQPLAVSGFQGAMFRRMIRSPGFRYVVTISRSLHEMIDSSHPELAGRMRVDHDGADDPRHIDPIELPDNGARLQIGYVGQLGRGRGIELICEMAERRQDMHFHFVGGAPPDVLRWREETRDYGNVTFHGFRPHAETDGFRQAFDVVLAPYQSDTASGLKMTGWMSPLKLFEYMAAGRPILVSDLPVLREVVDETCAVLVGGDDTESWLAALDRLGTESERRRLGTNARRRFEKGFTWSRRAERVLMPPE